MLRVCRSPVGDRVYSLVIGVEAPRSFLSRVSELWCEVGRVGALAPGEEPLSIPLPELSTGRVLCGPQGHPHRSTLVRAQERSSHAPRPSGSDGGSPDLVPASPPHGRTQEAQSCQEQIRLSHGSTCSPLGCRAALSLQSRQCRGRVRHSWVTEQRSCSAGFTKLAVRASVCVWHSHREI